MQENDSEIEVEVQEFDGQEYMLYATVIYEDSLFDIFSNTNNPDEIRVYRQINDNDEIYYEKASMDEYINVLAQLA